MANLNEAVQLIRQGRKDEARRILEPILKVNPQDIQAWFWYVETCSTNEQRIKTLEVCLKLNPGNPQALRALRALQGGPVTPPPSVSSPVSKQSAPPPAPQPDKIPDWARRPALEPVPPPPPASSVPAFVFDESEPESSSTPAFESSGGGWQQPRGESKPAFDWDALERESTPAGTKSPILQEETRYPEPKIQPRGEPLPFYRVWWQAVSAQSVAGYAIIFNDPDAGAGRAFEWMAYTSVLAGLLSPMLFVVNPQFAELRALPEFQELTGRISWTMLLVMMGLGMAVVTPILSIIGLAINAWIYNLLAVLFGGKGTFGRTVYGQAAYLAPTSLVVTLLNPIPVVGLYLAAPIGIYSTILNIRAIMAAHDLPVGRALGVILLPGTLSFVLCCVLSILFGPVLVNALPTSG